MYIRWISWAGLVLLLLSEAANARSRILPSPLWGLASIGAPQAAQLSYRSAEPITVAIIDTGADLSHPELSGRLWINAGETGRDSNGRDRATNGVDDDENGYVDDVHGWNFPGKNNQVADRHGHGTHIAGLIASVAPSAKLMILRYYDPASAEANAIPNTVRAIDYAVRNGARVINYSAGGPRPNAAERAAIERARHSGVLVVAAAGNEASNSDLRRYYPANYGIGNILCVTAIDAEGRVLPTSNWGTFTVDLAAPGDAVLSAVPGGKYGRMTGTSQATAFASGVAAWVMAGAPELRDPERLIDHLMASGTVSASLEGRTRSRAVLNAHRALAIQGAGVSASGLWAPNTAAIDWRLFTPEVEIGSAFAQP